MGSLCPPDHLCSRVSPGWAGLQPPGLEERGSAGAWPLLQFSRQEVMDLESISGLMENLLVSEVGKSFLKILWESKKIYSLGKRVAIFSLSN